MFFLQFAIHFDDFAKAAGMPYIGRNRNNARRASCLWQELLARLFLHRFLHPRIKKSVHFMNRHGIM